MSSAYFSARASEIDVISLSVGSIGSHSQTADWGWPGGKKGKVEASTTRSEVIPCTFPVVDTTDMGSDDLPIAPFTLLESQVDISWLSLTCTRGVPEGSYRPFEGGENIRIGRNVCSGEVF